jgi:hypothetical protein
MDKKITQLTQVTELTGAELLPLAQGGVTKSASVDQLRGYKVYTALLTQNDADNPDYISNSSLTIGVTYTINNFSPSYTLGDFTNVGAPNNNIGTSFVATGTTPNDWGGFIQLEYNTGAPVVKVLENTIGNIWFTYVGLGNYSVNSAGLFNIDKTFPLIGSRDLPAASSSGNNYLYVQSVNVITIETFNLSTGEDVNLYNTPIEIRVYN